MLTRFIKNKRRAVWLTASLGSLGVGALLLHAFNPQPDPPRVFGLVGITPFDVLRLNVSNVGSSIGGPPAPCRVQVGFVNAEGGVVKTENALIADGHSISLGLNYGEASATATATDTLALSRLRVNVRPVVNFLPPGPCFTGVSAELVDVATGRTNVYLAPEVKMPAPAATTVAN